ncbi:SHOCT domain-containing protein, partial [Burkholderia lata]|uniref:SHOCT domain-containing protein n=2 Tax=Burkholderia lata (strain ATCC 17760 / DSM 23089 / LMG 22485 / NCIMB 9086 / R18194 / 383) TaxID=482957 RepID=UPI001581F905
QPAPAAPPAPAAAPVAATQPAAPAEGTDYVQRLEQLKALFDKGLVTEDEYSRAKAEILAKLTR